MVTEWLLSMRVEMAPSQSITYIYIAWERDRCHGHQARVIDNLSVR